MTQTGGGGDADPRDGHAAAAEPVGSATGGGGEGDDARRVIELFEPAQNLLLLGLQPLRREDVVGQLGRIGVQIVHPPRELARRARRRCRSDRDAADASPLTTASTSARSERCP